MIDLGPHAIFIISAYFGVTVVVAGLILWTLFDARRTATRLAELEAQRPSR